MSELDVVGVALSRDYEAFERFLLYELQYAMSTVRTQEDRLPPPNCLHSAKISFLLSNNDI